MRIISKFRDYYDGVMRTGMDREVVYVRDAQKLTLHKKYELDYLSPSTRSGYDHGSQIRLMFLGYCGQIFKIAKVSWWMRHSPVSTPIENVAYFYDFEQFKKFSLDHGFASDWDFRKWSSWPGQYQTFAEQDTKPLLNLFHDNQVPLFLVTGVKGEPKKAQVILNPELKKVEFQKQKDPYTAYQDIFQYVAGVLNHPETKMVKISDKDKIHKHGFDKWSFRKMPTKKKK